jgi:4-amino-4-deoxy-L-arabinose transferase and related glycosyltransferases of PMT family
MKKFYRLIIFIFICLLPILIFRDYTPDNELKYLSIAQESIENGNIFAFYNHSQPYADKPPLYLWIVILGKLIFGQHVMFFLSLFSLIPAFIIVWLMNKWLKEEGIETSNLNGDIMLLTSGFFLACSFVLRMDMLMTMFILLATYTFYKMYKHNTAYPSEKNYKKLSFLFPIYTFLAIFTKGAVGIMVPLLVVVIFLAINKQIKTIGKYIGWKFWGVLIILCTCWFLGVFFDGGKEYLNNLLFHQTINRAVDSFHHKEPFYYYGITYWYAIAPWSIVTFIAIFLGFYKRLIKSDLEKILAIGSLGTILMMSFISSKIVIYLLPSFPFLIYLAAILIQKIRNNIWIKIGVAIPAIIFILAVPASFFIVEYVPIKLWAPLPLFASILGIGGAVGLYFVFKQECSKGIKAIGISLFVSLFFAGFSINNVNDILGLKNATEYAKSVREGIIEEGGNKPTISFYKVRSGLNMDAYFNEPIHEVLKEDLSGIKNTIMFVKEREFKRDSVLISTVGKMDRKTIGEYSVVIVK